MTELDWAPLKHMTNRITHEVLGICRVTYDPIPKPRGERSDVLRNNRQVSFVFAKRIKAAEEKGAAMQHQCRATVLEATCSKANVQAALS